MAFAPQIRKDMIKALDLIVPAIRDSALVQFLAEPPYDFTGVERLTIQEEPLPELPLAPMQYIRRWRTEKLMSVRHPVLCFIYSGVHYEKIGLTHHMVKAAISRGEEAAGVTLIRLPSPAIWCIPGNMPFGDGIPRMNSAHGFTKFVGLLTGENDLAAHLGERGPTHQFGSHHLQINDPVLVQMSNSYLDEMRQRDGREAAQAQLLALVLRLQRYLRRTKPVVSNSAWPTPEVPELQDILQGSHSELCHAVATYVQTHLHQVITLDDLASRLNISSVHLNRTFKNAMGTTVIQYVTTQRVNAAKEIISNTSERMQDVAQLVGFASHSSFCTVFHRRTGMTPNQFKALVRAGQQAKTILKKS